jgi:hypothetical protein
MLEIPVTRAKEAFGTTHQFNTEKIAFDLAETGSLKSRSSGLQTAILLLQWAPPTAIANARTKAIGRATAVEYVATVIAAAPIMRAWARSVTSKTK